MKNVITGLIKFNSTLILLQVSDFDNNLITLNV